MVAAEVGVGWTAEQGKAQQLAVAPEDRNAGDQRRGVVCGNICLERLRESEQL